MARRPRLACLPVFLALCTCLPAPWRQASAEEASPPAAVRDAPAPKAGAVLRALERHARAQDGAVRVTEVELGARGIGLRGTSVREAEVDSLARMLASDPAVLAYLGRDAVEPRVRRKPAGDDTVRISIDLRTGRPWEQGPAAGARPLGIDAGLDHVAALARKAGLDIEPPHVPFAAPYPDGTSHVSARITLRARVSRTGVLGLSEEERKLFDLLDADPSLRGRLHRGVISVSWQLPKAEMDSAMRAGTWEAGPMIRALRRHVEEMGARVRLLGFSGHMGVRVQVAVSSELALLDLRERLRHDPAVTAFIGKLRMRDLLRRYEPHPDGWARAEFVLRGNIQPYVPGSGLTTATNNEAALARLAALAAKAGVEPGTLRVEYVAAFRDGRVYANTWISVRSIGDAELKLLDLIAEDPTLCAPDARWDREPADASPYTGSKAGNGIAVLWRLDETAERAWRRAQGAKAR